MDAQALGRYLRESREAKELTLDDAERALKIRSRILEDFELGQFSFSDASSVQIRGFIRNYARYLGLDEDRVVGYYESARHETENPRRRTGKRSTQTLNPVAPRRITDTNPSLPAIPIVLNRPNRRSAVLNTLLMFLVAAASIAVIVFVVSQLVARPEAAAPDNGLGENILGQLPPSPSFTPPRPSVTPFPSPTPLVGLQQNYTGQPVLVTIQTKQRTWLRITSDGVQLFAGIAPPNTTLPDFPAQDNVTVTASNAEALMVIFNGQSQGTLGGRGQKVDIVFRPGGIEVSSGPGFEPTSEFTATPLPTSAIDVGAAIAALTPSPTPGPSPTPSLTPTITPTPSETPTVTWTPTITLTPSNTPTETDTPTITPTPTQTAVLPPRVTQPGLPPTKPPG